MLRDYCVVFGSELLLGVNLVAFCASDFVNHDVLGMLGYGVLGLDIGLVQLLLLHQLLLQHLLLLLLLLDVLGLLGVLV